MNWEVLSKLKKFTELEEIFEKIGKPKYKLNKGKIYYMGEGFFIAYTEKKFRVENLNREEFGEEGKYAFRLYYFKNINNALEYFRIIDEINNLDNKYDEKEFNVLFEINSNIKFKEMQEFLRENSEGVYYREGETRSIKNEKFEFQNNFIVFGNYEFLYFGKSKTTVLGGIILVLSE